MADSTHSLKTLITVLTVLGLLGGALTAWGTYGWITRTAYAQDHEGASVKTQQQAIITSLDVLNKALVVLQEGQDRNQDQWECDETDEELEDLAEEEDERGLSPTDKRQKTKLEEVWATKNCTRFTD